MNYQTQQLIRVLASIMTLGMCMGPPRVMFQTRPKAIERIIEQSIHEEEVAQADYDTRATIAYNLGDSDTAALFRHIAGEESHHAEEFRDRLKEVTS